MRRANRLLLGAGTLLGLHALYSVWVNHGIRGLTALTALAGAMWCTYVVLYRNPIRSWDDEPREQADRAAFVASPNGGDDATVA